MFCLLNSFLWVQIDLLFLLSMNLLYSSYFLCSLTTRSQYFSQMCRLNIHYQFYLIIIFEMSKIDMSFIIYGRNKGIHYLVNSLIYEAVYQKNIIMQGQNIGQQNLLDDLPNSISIVVTDRIFYQAYQYFKICNWVVLAYSFVRVICFPYFIFINPFSQIQMFLICMFIISCFQLLHYNLTRIALNNKEIYYFIAENTNHFLLMPQIQVPINSINPQYRIAQVYDFNDHDPTEDQRKMKLLAMQIKYQVQQSTSLMFYLGRIQFGLYHSAHFWGCLLLIFSQFPDGATKTFVTIIMILGTYQYLQFYLIIVFVILIVPFYGIRRLYGFLLNKYKAYRLQKMMRSRPINDSIKGDRQCHICLMQYQSDDSIIVLQCSQFHNFHASCLRQWAKTSTTCPLCRKDIASF